MQLPLPKTRISNGDVSECRQLLRGGSRTFYAASYLLPKRVRDAATILYAFCRLADDAVDLESTPWQALAELHSRLDGLYQGTPEVLPDRALAVVIRRFGIPREALAALLEGLEWDAAGHRYEDIGALRAYGVRVAGTVGVMLALLMGTRDRHMLARACDLGVAMQLTNIARDVGEDARDGRLYLPLEWLHEAGVDPRRFLECPRFTPALGSVISRLLDEAQRIYARADCGVNRLPMDCQPGIRAARLLYAEIGAAVRQGGLDSVSRRAVVPAGRKAALLARALFPLAGQPGGLQDPALAEGRYLVDAVEALTQSTGRDLRAEQEPAASGGLVGVIELFERLERRDRMTPLQREA